jgi:hypothetical protein
MVGELEIWVVVKEVPSYEVSTLGRVRRGARVLNPAPKKADGYVYVKLALGFRNRALQRTIHTLVAKAFLPNPNNHPIVNHKNWQRADNRMENLEWVSIKENRNKWSPDAVIGKKMRKVVQIGPAGNRLRIWCSARAAERELPGVSATSIAKCCRNNGLTCAGFRWIYHDDIEIPPAGEEWEDIEVKGKLWKVSSVGRVKTHTGHITYGSKSGGYCIVHDVRVHVLVARAFCQQMDGDTEVNHIDGNKCNNNRINLEWCTHAENIRHAVATGLAPKDTSTKLRRSVLQFMPDGTTRTYVSIMDAERKTGTLHGEIGLVCRGKNITAGGFRWAYAPTEPIVPVDDTIIADGVMWAILESELLAHIDISDDDPTWAALGICQPIAIE